MDFNLTLFVPKRIIAKLRIVIQHKARGMMIRNSQSKYYLTIPEKYQSFILLLNFQENFNNLEQNILTDI
jgi:hypothetical protein